jgi:hypothetical protein
MIILGLLLSVFGLTLVIAVIASELASVYRKRPNRRGSMSHLRSWNDPIIDEDAEDQKIIRALVTSGLGGLLLFAGLLVLVFSMISG